ncbi:anaerobic glycerol-3-phosphate dehydrogenase subunit C [Kordia sp. SMS9]|uniref:FAD-binding and (Fe-S)-binding domain-containing protein n=1 Tax=Kordia sp. SMS9 TaxID=2282170 RepID=UPI000E0D69A9|nr:FAD-binding and (Fe-S)-binding domain-containing protein [Kordia sp. SMS9]AXG71175.1 anaerobic glycerol-3-phosphate dehydrogenase subunit C [Kordia sp. SMS9]
MKTKLEQLKDTFSGTIFYDDLHKILYATDASVYRKLPLAVAYPKNTADLKLLIDLANTHQTSLIPRTAGTSLAGQCVGEGIVVDVSKHFTEILDIDENAKTVTVQPGVVRDALNNHLQTNNLFFGPNTSTSNRCMIGGMVGNNSSGTTSIQYGVTRDKVLEMDVLLSDGSEVTFGEISTETFHQKRKLHTLEGAIYQKIYEMLSEDANQKEIIAQFPKEVIHRRNTGYAIDELLRLQPFSTNGETFNMCKLLSGSEGTLAFTTKITLQLDDLQPAQSCVVAAHYESIEDCLQSVSLTMQHNLYTCEMMDKIILDCTKSNLAQAKNRFFVKGDPQAILLLELRSNDANDLEKQEKALIASLAKEGKSYHYPVLRGKEISQAMELRKAGLGLLGNIIGDKKAVACIEDTAVALEDLADYIAEFSQLMKKYEQKAVYYAHAGAGELHLRPILNLKKKADVVLFRKITHDVAKLVKKYNGSFSGEHGDGIVRAEFIPVMIGEKNYELLKEVKAMFDPNNIFNPGKIVDAAKMDTSLRYEIDREEPEIQTLFDFSDSQGILRAAEKCNGSGDCRKPASFSGAMCPSYRATKNEKDTTRARANALREFLTVSEKENKFDHKELKEVFDLCLSCKACASECPSNVDVAALKAEFLHQYYKSNKPTFRDKAFAFSTKSNRLASAFPGLSNFVKTNGFTSKIIKKTLGVAQERTLPINSSKTLDNIIQKSLNQLNTNIFKNKKVYIFSDEFTNYLESDIGQDALVVLSALGYEIKHVSHEESGRTFISKGFLPEAKKVANKNVAIFKDFIHENAVLVGIEPSAILTFRDEYIRLADDKEAAKNIAKHTYLLEEFLAEEIKNGEITSESFTEEAKSVKIHVHCYQKALSNQKCTYDILNLPKNYKPTIIASGCCGMAGSFGYEKEHYEVSMNVGEQSLFPAVRAAEVNTIIAANGTSCRHQIKDGTSREALHPITVLRQALV